MPLNDDKIVIYKLTFPSGKLYIGQTKNLENRIKQHIRASRENINRPLYDAIRHYGENSFSIDVLEECDIQNADEREVYYIKTLNTQVKSGYNLDGGGQTNRNISEETKKKISDAAKQRFSSPEYKFKMRSYLQLPRKPRPLAAGMNWQNNCKNHLTNSKYDSILYM